MEYRKLPKGIEKLSVIGIGLGGIQENSDEDIQNIIEKAIANGINFFDLCCGAKNVFLPFAKAIESKRDKIYFQLHFGTVYDSKTNEYCWSRNLKEIKETFEYEMKALNTDYVDFGFLHCVDEIDDFEELCNNGVFDFLKELKEKNIVHHIGFSSHTPAVANKVLDTGIIDLMMFSINPAYDCKLGDELGVGDFKERQELFLRCEKDKVAISVMKPFFAGKLLDDASSPFKKKLNVYQCLQYALDRPSVISCMAGVSKAKDLDELIAFSNASDEEKDYSILGSFNIESFEKNCVYCNHCQPCPAKLNIGLINKYYDLARANDKLAIMHYNKLSKKASDCIQCKHCDNHCPFQVKQSKRMLEIDEFFKKFE